MHYYYPHFTNESYGETKKFTQIIRVTCTSLSSTNNIVVDCLNIEGDIGDIEGKIIFE